jgi:hypothetical protein
MNGSGGFETSWMQCNSSCQRKNDFDFMGAKFTNLDLEV